MEVLYAKRALMPDIYDKDVDRRAIEVAFKNGQKTIVLKYMIMENFNVKTQLKDGDDDYWCSEVNFYGYRKRPRFSRETWDKFDSQAQEYINLNGVK